MIFLDFAKPHPVEKSCIQHFRMVKKDKRSVCARCGHTTHYCNKANNSHDCKECGYRTTFQSGTVMDYSKLSFQ